MRAGASRSAPSLGIPPPPSHWRSPKTGSSSAATFPRSGRRWPKFWSEAGEEGAYDFAFIDADKAGYDGYYERLLRPGGLIAIDNTLWGGAVLDQDTEDADARAIQALNTKLAGDARITLCLLPVADGVTLARRR